jgi:hypothetical protein
MLSSKSASGTSFHGDTIVATFNELVEVIGYPQAANNNGEDKTNYDWVCETDEGVVFTIYDWKEYRPIDDDEKIEWHIGAADAFKSISAQEYMEKLLAE